jgi:hypothetical protein
MMLQTVVLEGRASRERENLLTPLMAEFRDVDADAAGNIYALVRRQAGQEGNSGKLLKLEPAD